MEREVSAGILIETTATRDQKLAGWDIANTSSSEAIPPVKLAAPGADSRTYNGNQLPFTNGIGIYEGNMVSIHMMSPP